MDKVTSISPVTAGHLNAVHKLDSEIVAAILKAKDAGMSQGLIVAILHAHATKETISMIGM